MTAGGNGVTAIFGGSFDPVHLGHVSAVRALIAAVPDISRVIVMPASVSPFKMDRAPGAAPEQRLEMCRRAFGNDPKCEISDYEINAAGVSYTINTLEYLREKYTKEKLLLTLGSDSLATLPKWYRFTDIIKIADIAAISRSEEDSGKISGYAEKVRSLGGNVLIVQTAPFEISSSRIREMIGENKDISPYVDEKTAEYIKENKIYGRRQ